MTTLFETKFTSAASNSSNTGVAMEHPVTLSLFTGGGGLDVGFHNAGFRIVACVEIDKPSCDTLSLNLGRYMERDCRIITADIRDLAPEDVTREEIDFIIGGPPCQSFSAIGRRAGGVEGILDKRGSLFEHYCRFIRHFEPRGFLFENVRGILGANGGADWAAIRQAFANLGYQLAYRVLDSAGYGVPQHRERLIMIGSRETQLLFPQPTHGPDSASKTPYTTALDAIADLQTPDEEAHLLGGKYGHLLQEVPPGQNYHYFTKEMGYPNPQFAWRSRFSDFLYKADPNAPVRTIVAKLGAYSGPFHWKNRKFTLEEMKRLQSFPDDYRFTSGKGAALQQIGNSVPPLFAWILAMSVKQQLFHCELGVDLLPETHSLTFDSRKSHKARATRGKRTKRQVKVSLTPSLFAALENDSVGASDSEQSKIVHRSEVMLAYLAPKRRIQLPDSNHGELENVFQIRTNRCGSTISIEVARKESRRFVDSPLLAYHLMFDHPIGDGVTHITCALLSKNASDIAVAWDSIEDAIAKYSGYRTMMDVYGHFTEPHPSFTLDMDVIGEISPVLRFAKKFSKFENCAKIIPGKVLTGMFAEDHQSGLDLSQLAQFLRSLRFDVRVHETNPTIPIGYFRCCYPFTINIDKQVSVTWKERVQ